VSACAVVGQRNERAQQYQTYVVLARVLDDAHGRPGEGVAAVRLHGGHDAQQHPHVQRGGVRAHQQRAHRKRHRRAQQPLHSGGLLG